jgi:peptidoglycan/LPS O-acetylase OafA/YrhL
MIKNFESIRGIAALIVALYHLNIGAAFFPVVRNGYLFVDLFFVLSGFIMCAAYGSKINTVDSVYSFVIRRIGRLYPLLIFSTLFFVIVANAIVLAKRIAVSYGYAGVLNNPNALEYLVPTTSEVLATLTLTHAMGVFDRLILNTPSWSISVEFYAYFLFAALTLLLKGRARLVAFGILSLVGFAVSVWASTTVHECLEEEGCLSLTYDFGFARCVYSFCLGALAFYGSRMLPPNPVGLQIVAMSMLAVLVWAVDTFPALAFAFPIAFTVLVLSICNDTGPLHYILKLAPLQILGERSYSIYLMHMPLLLLFENVAKRADGVLLNTMVLLLYVTTLIVVAGWTYKFIENPFRSAFNRFADRSAKLKASPAN